MREDIQQKLHAPELGPCACSQVRKLARKLSSWYDAALAPENLTITQYSLLANIARAGQLAHTALADKLGMERTTLTRNLRPLARAKLVVAATGLDRRQHLLQLTAAGKRKLYRSLPLWEEAQRRFLSLFGSKSIQDLRLLLGSAEKAATKAFTIDQEKPKSTRLRARKKSTHASRSHRDHPRPVIRLPKN
jgi:DNA-binding MarR family transcriptional regulator